MGRLVIWKSFLRKEGKFLPQQDPEWKGILQYEKKKHKLDLSKIKCFNWKTSKQTHIKVKMFTWKEGIFNQLSRVIHNCTKNISQNLQFTFKKKNMHTKFECRTITKRDLIMQVSSTWGCMYVLRFILSSFTHLLIFGLTFENILVLVSGHSKGNYYLLSVPTWVLVDPLLFL